MTVMDPPTIPAADYGPFRVLPEATTDDWPATEKQVNFALRLKDEREVPADLEYDVVWVAGGFPSLTKKQASAAIDLLLAAPRKAGEKAEKVEPGFYVRGEDAFKVVLNRAKTHTYALVWSGSSWDYAPGKVRSLSGMTPMTGEQAAALGLASGKCINCLATLGGETLSAKVSALIGYGETCAKNNGWAYPKGVVAQRAYVAERVEAGEVLVRG